MEEQVLNALEIQNLCVNLGTFKIENLNLNIIKGAITGLIGANGAGKSTLIKTVMRCVRAESGKILYGGKRFAGNEKQILSSVACVFDDVVFSVGSKPKTLKKIYSSVYPNFDGAKYDMLVERFRLPQNIRVQKYSFGMKKKLSFVIALCQGAELLILDEPTSGIDPYDRNELTTLIQEYMLDENHTVLFSTHITEDLDKIADYIVMMDDGRITLNDSKDNITQTYRLVRCTDLTDEMRTGAIGLKQDMFGYTFVTKDKNISGEGVQVKTPTIEELFVHLLGERKNPAQDVGQSSQSIFGM